MKEVLLLLIAPMLSISASPSELGPSQHSLIKITVMNPSDEPIQGELFVILPRGFHLSSGDHISKVDLGPWEEREFSLDVSSTQCGVGSLEAHLIYDDDRIVRTTIPLRIRCPSEIEGLKQKVMASLQILMNPWVIVLIAAILLIRRRI